MTVTVEIPQETFIGSGVNLSESFPFSIVVTDPCASTSMSVAPLGDMLAYVNSTAVTQTVLATDSVSETNGNLDGVSFCGPRAYSISPSSPSFLGLSGDTLTLLSTNPVDVTTSPI